MTNYFKQFLIGYVSAGHTISDEAHEEIKKLTTNFINIIDKENYYREIALHQYFEYLKEHMSDENIGFFHLYFNENRYKNIMSSYLRKYL